MHVLSSINDFQTVLTFIFFNDFSSFVYLFAIEVHKRVGHVSKFGLSVIPEHSDNPDSKGEEGTGVEFLLNFL